MQPRSLPNFKLSNASPLAQLLRDRRNETNYIRGSRFHHLLDPFRLQEAVVVQEEGRHCRINGRKIIHFASSDYLGLEQHPEVLYAARRALEENGAGASSPRMISIQSNLAELESSIAHLLRLESCLVGHNSAQVHMDAISLLFGDEDCTLFVDRHADVAIYHAARAAAGMGARIVRVDISDPPSLRRVISQERPRRGALLMDGVFRNQGHSPDLASLDELCRSSNLILYIDDTHGIGISGQNGGGSCEAFQLHKNNLVIVASMQAAFGSYGAFLAGPKALTDFLRVTASTFLSSGTLPPEIIESALAAVRISRSPEGLSLRQRLLENARMVRARLQALGFVVPPGEGPIIPIAIGKDLKTLMAGKKLFDLGVLVAVLVHPEVPKGRGMFRISLTASHSHEDIEALVEAFRELRHYLPKHENPLRQAAHVATELYRARWRRPGFLGAQTVKKINL